MKDLLNRALHRRRRAPRLHVASDVGTGPPVVLVHGITSTSTTFHFLVPMLESSHRVISIDILGFGRSPQPPGAEYTMAEHEAALDRTIRGLRLREPFVLTGHSLGSLIASRYASRHTREVSHLVLVSPPVYVMPKEIGNHRNRFGVTAYLKIYDYLRDNPKFTIDHARTVARFLPVKHVLEITDENWEPFVKSLKNCIESETVIDDIAHVSAPIDVVYGRLDEFIAPGSLAVLERMRDVTMHQVAASDHMIRKPLARVAAAAINHQSPNRP